MDEKPLHVRVAEALGWSDLKAMELVPSGIAQWWGKPPDDWVRQNGLFVGDIDREGRRVTLTPNYGLVPRYDADWAATGPLIAHLGLDVTERDPGLFVAGVSAYRGVRSDEDPGWPLEGTGPGHLGAVCDLILKLKSAGQLEL